uniref:BPTI/Kunitz inhibitor domain-containing protein n=1 Tax=Mesocestoides corti TaxID=53468 RepID=A0A5K3F2N1_MESCO
MGKQCFNPKVHSVGSEAFEQCRENYYFTETGQRNVYSNMENCKFVCAIVPKCVAVEFSEGSFCILLSTFESTKMTRQLGTTTLRKPPECEQNQNVVDPVGYPYAMAIDDLYASLS